VLEHADAAFHSAKLYIDRRRRRAARPGFYRGLITHDAFVEDPGALNNIMEEFINMLAQMMQRRPAQNAKKTS